MLRSIPGIFLTVADTKQSQSPSYTVVKPTVVIGPKLSRRWTLLLCSTAC